MVTKDITHHIAKQVRDKITREWGSAFHLLGPRLQTALRAEAVLIIAATQDASIPAETVRRIVDKGWDWVIDEDAKDTTT